MIRLFVLFLICFGTLGQAQTSFGDEVTTIAEPSKFVEIKATVNGRIQSLLVKEGQRITKGQALGEMDARVQQSRVSFARVAAEGQGAILRAETALAQAEALRERVEKARAKGAAQDWEVIQTQQAVALARADLAIAHENRDQAKAQLQLETATLSEFSLIAPFSGTVLEVFPEAGETIDTQTAIMELGQLDVLRATAFVPVEWLSALEVGATLPARLQTIPPREIAPKVGVIDPRVDSVSQTVRIVIELDNMDRAILVGTSIAIFRP